MADPDTVLGAILSIEGTVDAYIMDDELSSEILAEERSVRSLTGMDVINRGYEEAMDRMCRVCMIVGGIGEGVSSGAVRIDRSPAVMVNGRGDIVGMTLSEEEIPVYIGRDDIVWVSDDFILFIDAEHDSRDHFELQSSSLPYLNEMDGVSDSIMAFPCTGSDMILRAHSTAELPDRCGCIVVAFDLRDESRGYILPS